MVVQIYTIIGMVKKSAPRHLEDEEKRVYVPLVYALLPGKQQEAYATVLRAVKNAATRYGVPILRPPRMMMDFEVAQKNAAEEVYRNRREDPEVKYCFYHLGQSVYRHVQDEGLRRQYNNPDNRSIKEATHMLLSLAFVPLDDLEASFDLLVDEVPLMFLPVTSYFEKTYIRGIPRRRGPGRVAPRFLPALWNCYEATLRDEHRTNNISEGWHNRFQHAVGKHHPSLYGALTEFVNEQADTESILAAFELGQAVSAAPKRKWVKLQEQIRTVVGSYADYKDDNNIIGYLRTLGHKFVL